MADGIEQVSSAAAGLLEAIGNLQRGDIRDLAVSTATNSSSVPSTSRSSEGNAIAAELGRRFPTFNARGGRGNTSSKKRSSSSSPMSREGSSKFGRPIKHIVHKDLVVIPNPNTNQVPSHTSKVKLEERGLIIHEFPFDRRWTPLDLKRNIESHLPRDDILFDYLKVSESKSNQCLRLFDLHYVYICKPNKGVSCVSLLLCPNIIQYGNFLQISQE